MSERDETARRIAETFPGPRGPKGERGAKGEPLSPALRRALAYLFVLVFLLIGLAYWGLYRQQQGDEQQRCGSIAQAVGIPVPVPTAGNPSREWVAKFSAIERQRGKQLGCDMPPPRFVTEAGH